MLGIPKRISRLTCAFGVRRDVVTVTLEEVLYKQLTRTVVWLLHIYRLPFIHVAFAE